MYSLACFAYCAKSALQTGKALGLHAYQVLNFAAITASRCHDQGQVADQVQWYAGMVH